MLAQLQRYFVYRPIRAEEISPAAAGLPDGRILPIRAATHDHLELNGWHVLPGDPPPARDATGGALVDDRLAILFFPGSAAHRGYRGSELELLSSLGVEVLLFDYRGYGDNPGRPSERAFAADARSIWKYATEVRRLQGNRLVLLGESIGGAVATRLAAELSDAGTAPAGLIVRSTFSTLPEAAAHKIPWFPVQWFMPERYPSLARIPRVKCPVLAVHGQEDRVVPLRLARRLFEAAPPAPERGPEKRFVVLPEAGHNNVHHVARDAYRRAVSEFLDDVRRHAAGLRTNGP